MEFRLQGAPHIRTGDHFWGFLGRAIIFWGFLGRVIIFGDF